VLIFLPLRLFIHLQRDPENFALNLRIYLWFLPIEIKLKNPLTSTLSKLSSEKMFASKKVKDLRARDVAWKRVFRRLKLFRTYLLPVFLAINRFFHKSFRPIKLKKLSLYTEIGLEDATVTALAVGIIWSIKGVLYTRLAELFNTQNTENRIVVWPNYKETSYLRVDYSCIFEFRLGHIMIMIYYLFRSMAEIRKLIRRVST